MENLYSYVEKTKKNKITRKRMAAVLVVLSIFVSFGVVWSLRGTGISMAGTPMCGKEEHQHTAECYEDILICELEETQHVHTEDCYQTEQILTCGQEECEPSKEHIHTEDCYQTEQVLICELEENEGHQHTQACYEYRLTCEKEEHQHTAECYSDPSADLETAAVWEKTLPDTLSENWDEALLAVAESQIGYTESSRNFILDDNGNKKGYTRYGEWYGSPYGDWCAMFISFCLHYAGIPDEAVPYAAGYHTWQVQLNDLKLWENSQYTPVPGDLVFFDYDDDNSAEQVGIVESVDDERRMLYTIEGNSGDAVIRREYNWNDANILGYCNLGLARSRYENAYELNYNGEDYTVTVRYTADAQIPENAVLSARELSGEEYDESCRQAMEAMGVDKLSFARFFDVSFLSDGEEIEPSAPVDVTIQYAERVEVEEGQISNAIHFTSDGTEVLDTEVEQEEGTSTVFSFTQSSFSTVGIAVGMAAVPYADRPNSQTGTHTNELKEGEWYILYAVNDDGTGYAISTANPTKAVVLNQASTNRGAVKYSGSEDVLWQYTANGFCNSSGQYLTFTHKAGSWWESDISCSASTTHAGVTYNATYNALYNMERTPDPNGDDALWYNTVWAQLWVPGFSGCSAKSLGVPQDRRHYIALVSNGGGTTTGSRHPMGSVTGTPDAGELVLYNIDASENSTPKPLAGVEYTIYSSDGNGNKTGIVRSLATVDAFSLAIGRLDPGTYIVEQTGVPDGYVVYPQTREFTVGQDGRATIGVFYDYKAGEDGFYTEKTAQVIDYINRTYEIDLSAASGKYGYDLDNLNFSLVVDQSNSMLFPAELTDTEKTVRLYGQGKSPDTWSWGVRVPGTSNSSRLDDLKLDKSQVYYIITDESQSSTVWAIWYDSTNKGWCYQDASYYAKAQFHELGLTQNVLQNEKTVEFPKSNEAYDGAKAGGGLNQAIGGGLSGDKETDVKGNGSKEYKLYTGSQYNRLHELQEGVSILASLLGSLNESTTLQLVTFCSTVKTCTKETLNNNGVQQVIDAVNKISTDGGTRQDLALNHVSDKNENDIKSGKKNYVILITDGAPVGTSPDKVKTSAKNLTDRSKNGNKDVTLITVGLSMKNVVGGSQTLKDIASDRDDGGKWSYAAESSGELSNILMNEIFGSIAKLHFSAATSAIRDTISSSFYPINPDTNAPLESGTWIGLDGKVLTNPSTGQKKNAGQVLYDDQAKEWYVEWSDQILPEQSTGSKWSGKLYVKAKEDFIGGNAIDTNKSATITLKDGEQLSSKPLEMESPTVNVRLLEMDKYTAEATVFLGDPVCRDGYDEAHKNGIPDVMEDFYGRIAINKIVPGTGSVYNKADATEEAGCHEKTFTLPYAIGQLTREQWERLERGESLTIPYTYDDDSSHGPVGEFTLKLRQEGVGHNGETWGYEPHEMHEVGHNVCKYYLDVTYTAYKLGEKDRPDSTVHNGEKGPGTEVGGSSAGPTVQEGAGTYTKTHEYDISVLDGKIAVKKEIDSTLVSAQEQTYAFLLSRLEVDDKGETAKTKVAYGTVTIPAGQSEAASYTLQMYDSQENLTDTTYTGEGALLFQHLKRGSYLLEEPNDDQYHVDGIQVQEDNTNCPYHVYEEDSAVSFHIGYRPVSADDDVGEDVIRYGYTVSEDGHHIIYSDAEGELADYHAYSYGYAKITNTRTTVPIEIPVRKIWGAGTGKGEVYVALCDQDGNLVLNSDGKAQLLSLKTGNNWTDKFTVSLPSGTPVPDYTIREVVLSDTAGTEAVIVNEGDSPVYIEKVIQEHELIVIGGEDYSPEYGKDEGTLIVTNHNARKLPDAGGPGTMLYIVCGLAMIAGGFLYGCGLRHRKCERRLK